MAYSKLLNIAIASTDYTQEEVAQECCKLGVKVSRSQINKWLNKKSKPPRAEVSRAIATVCNVDERKLVIEGYMENAPKEIQDLIKMIRNFAYSSTIAATSVLGI